MATYYVSRYREDENTTDFYRFTTELPVEKVLENLNEWGHAESYITHLGFDYGACGIGGGDEYGYKLIRVEDIPLELFNATRWQDVIPPGDTEITPEMVED